MKQDTRIQKRKHQHQHPPQQAQPRPQPARSSSPWRWVLLVACALLAAFGTWAVFENYVWSKLPAELVGKWIVVGGEQEGATFDFYPNGTMVARINVNGKEGIIKAAVRVEDESMFITTQNPHTGASERKVQKINTLDGQNLIVVDDKGREFKMKRAD